MPPSRRPSDDKQEPSASRSLGPADAPRILDAVDAILGRDGTLSQRESGYEERPQQLEMARLVARALCERQHVVVEAGTGTGKTLAYLVPALASGLTVVVSTATRALQEQLAQKDLPLLLEIGGMLCSHPVSFQVMKGRQNYLCLLRWEQFEAAPAFVSREEARLYAKLREWAHDTATGDRAELDLPDRYVAWRELSSTAETCLGQTCPRWGDCHVTRMRQRAQDADVVVVNHHLYFADLAVRRASGSRSGAEVVPRHDVVVMDEAHNLEEIATEFYGTQLSNYRVYDLCRDLERAARTHPEWPGTELARTTSRLARSADALFQVVAGLAPESARPGARTTDTHPHPRTRSRTHAPSESLFERASARAPREVAASDEEILARAAILSVGADDSSDERRDTRWALPPGGLTETTEARETFVADLRGLETLLERIAAAREDVELDAGRRRSAEMRDQLGLFSGPSDPGYVHWAEVRGRGVFLRASPVDVAEDLRRDLFLPPRPVVMTSATLATGGDLRFFRRRVGLAARAASADDDEVFRVEGVGEPAEPLEAVLASPFDFGRQAALYLPRHLPEPNDPEFTGQAVEELAALTALAGGRTFALFTSLRAMNEAHRRLGPRLPFRVLLQGEKPKAALLRDFRETPSVLFATQSFWEGVDVPGDALSLVVIDRLPFASPGDPLVQARLKAIEDRGGSSFTEYTLPSAAITLKQGFGRLIRTRRDTGAVAVLDRRIWTKSYGGFFRRTLPACPTFDRFADLKRWWRETRSPGRPD